MTILNEDTLKTPVFVGETDDIQQALSSWQQVVNALTCLDYLTPGNKQGILDAIICLVGEKTAKDLEYERETHQATPSLTPAVPNLPAEPAVAIAAPMAQPSFTMESVAAKADNLRRMRELAGIPHDGNRV